MTTQHTPGRLSISNDADIIGTENDPESGWVGTVHVAHVYLRIVPGRTEANRRRLVACWNACEGLTTRHLENLDMLGETLAGRFAAFRANECELLDTRDELLAALKAIIADGLHCDVVPHLHQKAIAAIAKAERKE